MKRLVLVIAVMTMSLSAVFAQEFNRGNEPFKIDIHQLSAYLDLSPRQVNDVFDINELFIQNQRGSFNSSETRQESQLRKVVYSNLKQMKSVLSNEQYRKYVALINVTNYNNGAIDVTELPEELLAESK